tara:strand:- start:330 stop:470 length:141 start_codon:yes stop_codon:yes gene_type:complete
MKDKLVEFLSSENPIFETLLAKDKNNILKLLFTLKNIKKTTNKNNK